MVTVARADREHIAAAVSAAEAQTRAEFVTVIARRADHYLTVPILLAAGLALIVPGLGWLVGAASHPGALYAIQLVVFPAAVYAFAWSPVAMRLVPRAAQLASARRLAREQFHERGLHRTPEGTGVLFFVSLAEHYVEIIADDAAHAAVPEGTWQKIVDSFTGEVRTGRLAEGFSLALAAVGQALHEKLPRRPEDPNRLADRLIEL